MRKLTFLRDHWHDGNFYPRGATVVFADDEAARITGRGAAMPAPELPADFDAVPMDKPRRIRARKRNCPDCTV